MGPEDYRGKAADCLYLTQRLADEQSRRLLLEMARAWIELAVRAERNRQDGHRIRNYATQAATPERLIRPALRPRRAPIGAGGCACNLASAALREADG
jgi:hypothetical protein